MFEINQEIETKKPHACGCNKWIITRTGADYKIKCASCGRELLINSDKLKKIIKKN